ncbi:hypothetical protein THAOC_37436, partial [Thalassiosira oceanica]
AGSADPPSYRGGSPTTRRPSRRDGPPPQDGPRRPEIKGILKKRGAPIPITQFGRPVLQFHEDDGGDGGGDGASDSDGGTGMDESDPDMTEEKSSRSAPRALATGGNRDDDRSAYSSATQTTLGTARSGLRSGKWAAANERALAAQAGHVDDDEGDDEDGTEYDYEDPEYDALSAASDEHTLKSAADARFDRSRSHFLRTADLGLTQDTIYAEQFLEDERTKPEPHYHHPSPHPPPGVQFNIDENWVSVDDGRGGHSHIAPQAVDALVAMGYRAASDPMMWTPTSKTRKYMTEKELRFDDIPIPGSVDEGVGGPDDGDCLVWSGKFPHKPGHRQHDGGGARRPSHGQRARRGVQQEQHRAGRRARPERRDRPRLVSVLGTTEEEAHRRGNGGSDDRRRQRRHGVRERLRRERRGRGDRGGDRARQRRPVGPDRPDVRVEEAPVVVRRRDEAGQDAEQAAAHPPRPRVLHATALQGAHGRAGGRVHNRRQGDNAGVRGRAGGQGGHEVRDTHQRPHNTEAAQAQEGRGRRGVLVGGVLVEGQEEGEPVQDRVPADHGEPHQVGDDTEDDREEGRAERRCEFRVGHKGAVDISRVADRDIGIDLHVQHISVESSSLVR